MPCNKFFANIVMKIVRSCIKRAIYKQNNNNNEVNATLFEIAEESLEPEVNF